MEVVKRPKHMELIDCWCVMTTIAAPWDFIGTRMRQMENVLCSKVPFKYQCPGPSPIKLALSRLQQWK